VANAMKLFGAQQTTSNKLHYTLYFESQASRLPEFG